MGRLRAPGTRWGWGDAPCPGAALSQGPTEHLDKQQHPRSPSQWQCVTSVT